MKMEYVSPVMEVLSFAPKGPVMDSGGDCMGFSCPDGICVVDGTCITDGICFTDGTVPNISAI